MVRSSPSVRTRLLTEQPSVSAPAAEAPAARARKSRLLSHVAWAGLILVVALAARSFWVAYAPSDPTDGRAFNDAVFYYHAGANLALGKGYVQTMAAVLIPTAYWPPGYPFLLAGLFKVFGAHVAIAWGANIVLGALTCVALYFLGRLIAGWKTGVAAGLLLALFPGHVFFSSLVLSEVTFTFLVVIASLLIVAVARQGERPRVWQLLVLGVTIGAAALVRGQGLLLLPLAALFWWLHNRNLLSVLKRSAPLTVIAFAVILPWVIRNYVSMGSFVLISTNEGGNLYVGNFEGATGHMVYGMADWAAERYSNLPPEKQEVAINNLLLREGLKFMFTHPQKEMQLIGSKMRGLYEDDEEALRGIPNRGAGVTLRNQDLIAKVADYYYFAAVALSGIGLLVWLRRPRGALALPLLLIAVFTFGQLLFFTDPRFHYPMLPAFALLAAAGLTAAVDQARQRLPGHNAESKNPT